MRSGIVLWVDKEMATKVVAQLERGGNKFLVIGDRAVNTADLSGVFTDKEQPSRAGTELIDGQGNVRQLKETTELKEYDQKEYDEALDKLGYKISEEA